MQQVDHFGKQRAGLLCYIVGMVVILTIYRVSITVIVQLELFKSIADYQHHIEITSTVLLFLMLGFLWMAYRQWQSIIYERDQLETILESIGPDMIIAIDCNNRILRCGGAVKQMSGYTPEELIGQKTDLLYRDRQGDGQGYEIQSALQHSGFHLGYATGRTKDDKDYLLEVQTAGMSNRTGGAVLILHNLDERQHSRAQLQRRVRMEEIFATLSSEFFHTKPNLFETTCRNALHQIAEILDHEVASIGFFDRQNGAIRDIWTWRKNQDSTDLDLHAALANAAESIETNNPVVYTFPKDLKTAPPALAELYTQEKICSIVLSPMQLQDRCVGFLAIYSKTRRNQQWASEDTSFLQAVTNMFLSGDLCIHAITDRQDDSPNEALEPQRPNTDDSAET